jgi:PAS domain S-box-containing protein
MDSPSPCEHRRVGLVACEADALQAHVTPCSTAFEIMFETPMVAMAYLDRNFDFVRVNRNYASADGRAPEWYVGKNHFELFPNPDNQRIFERVRQCKTAYSAVAKPFEYAHNPERGVSHWDWTLSPLLDAQGGVAGFVLMLVDVSDRVRAIEALQQHERRLEQQLAEKEVLLREIHHRVKNNLQIVSSLLYLQAAQERDAELTRHLDKSRDRIRAMSLVHEVLHDAENLARVSFAAYLRELVAALVSAHQRDTPRVHVGVEVEHDGPLLDVETVAPCGLIIGELLSNAFEHAFVGREQGHVEVRVCARPDGGWSFSVIDDGVGLPLRIRYGHSGLGLRLVAMLTEQVGGQLHLPDVAAGTHFRVDLPL